MPAFLGIIPVKSIKIVQGERFTISEKDDRPLEVKPMSLDQIKAMGDISDKDLYILPNPPRDIQTGIFKVCIF